MTSTQVMILQSAANDRAAWIDQCVRSVREWAAMHEYEYLWLGDELFEDVPDWYKHKVGKRKPIAADLGRLLWIRRLLRERAAQTIVWVDADTLVFAPDLLHVELVDHCQFGVEHWLQAVDGKPRVYRNVHNAWCAFRQDSPTLDFLIDTVTKLVDRVDKDFIAPQFVGPKLLTSLHNIVGFELTPHVGALSPLLDDAIRAADEKLLEYYHKQAGEPVYAFNLCASLQENRSMNALIDLLLEYEAGFGPSGSEVHRER